MANLPIVSPGTLRAFAAAGVGLLEIDLERGVVTRANRTAGHVIGRPRRDLVGGGLLDFVPADHRPDDRSVRLQLAAGVPFRAEVRLAGSEGAPRWLHLTVGTDHSTRRVPRRRAYALVRDITARKQAGSPPFPQLGPFFDDAPLRISLYEGPDHVCALTSRTFLDAVGGGLDVGARAGDVLPDEALGVLDRALTTGEAVVEADVLTADGAPGGRLSLAASPWFLPSGNAGGVIAVAIDAASAQALHEPTHAERRIELLEQTLREGTFHLTFDPPVRLAEIGEGGLDRAPARLETSDRAAELIGLESTPYDVPRPAGAYHPKAAALLDALVRDDLQLLDWATTMSVGGRERHLLINAVSERDGDALVSVWGSITDATEQVHLHRRLAEALDEAQDGISRDLHDGIGPYLTAVRMLSEKLVRDVADVSPALSASAEKLAEFATDATRQVEALYRGLSPTALVENGLHAALEQLCQDTVKLPGISCGFEGDALDLDAPLETQLQLYRIAQEAVHNAVKHGRPDRIAIRLTRARGGACLQVEDDGRGFDVDRPVRRGHHIGLDSMRVRARAIGGDLEISSVPGHGTRVTCWFAPP